MGSLHLPNGLGSRSPPRHRIKLDGPLVGRAIDAIVHAIANRIEPKEWPGEFVD